MFTRPEDLDQLLLARALADGWSFGADRLTYRPVGFGSHHWLAEARDGSRLFATVDELPVKRHGPHDTNDAVFERLATAFATVRDLRLPFALAPVVASDGHVLVRLAPRYSLVVHPFVDGEPVGEYGEYHSDADRLAVLDMLVRLHQATPLVSGRARVDDFAVPSRREFGALLRDLSRPWQSGPYADRVRSLLSTHAGAVAKLFRVYDALVAAVRERPGRMVVTHGEPHPGNVLRTGGGLVLIDWDTIMIAPPERDLWGMAQSAPQVLDSYADATGVAIDSEALTLYRLWWDLAEICLYVTQFAKPHTETRDVAESWNSLNYYLHLADRWPEFI